MIRNAEPCPWCDGEVTEWRRNYDVTHVCCTNCLCQARGPLAKTKEEATEKWDRVSREARKGRVLS